MVQFLLKLFDLITLKKFTFIFKDIQFKLKSKWLNY